VFLCFGSGIDSFFSHSTVGVRECRPPESILFLVIIFDIYYEYEYLGTILALELVVVVIRVTVNLIRVRECPISDVRRPSTASNNYS
jgi:hypothetical protein